MQKKPDEKVLDRSIKDGAAYSVAAGAGEAYVAAYAVMRGASDAFIGSLTSVPALVGALVQLAAPYAANGFRNRKLVVLGSIALNALSWLLILSTVFVSAEAALPSLLIFFTIYAATNAFANPLWSGWMADLIPEQVRGWFFGKRNAVAQMASLAATLAAGFLLGFLQNDALLGFALLFSAAFIARLASLRFLAFIPDEGSSAPAATETPFEFLKSPFNAEARATVLLTSLFIFVVYFASPFFVVYQFRDLHFGYLEYTFLLAVASIARIVAMPYWGKMSQLFGNKLVLVSCAAFASIVPILWLTSTNIFVLAIFEMFGGFVWAGIDLAAFNYVLCSVKHERVPCVMSNYNFFTGIARFGGPIIGTLLILHFDAFPLLWGSLPSLLLVSGVSRLAVVALMALLLHETVLLVPRRGQPLLVNMASMHPVRGLTSNLHLVWSAVKNNGSRAAQKGARAVGRGAAIVGKGAYAIKGKLKK